LKLAHINFLMAGPHLTWLELLIRLGSALLLGGVIGAERQWRQRTTGLRTYSLVSIGAALFVLLATLIGVREEGCRGKENRVRTLLIQLLTNSPLILQEVESVVGNEDKDTVIKATLTAEDRNDSQIEQITSRLILEREVIGVSWQALPTTNAE
jgi:uncharacterized membrane protein YhiD involved in acid resistance